MIQERLLTNDHEQTAQLKEDAHGLTIDQGFDFETVDNIGAHLTSDLEGHCRRLKL
jgi:hypothetical protein